MERRWQMITKRTNDSFCGGQEEELSAVSAFGVLGDAWTVVQVKSVRSRYIGLVGIFLVSVHVDEDSRFAGKRVC